MGINVTHTHGERVSGKGRFPVPVAGARGRWPEAGGRDLPLATTGGLWPPLPLLATVIMQLLKQCNSAIGVIEAGGRCLA